MRHAGQSPETEGYSEHALISCKPAAYMQCQHLLCQCSHPTPFENCVQEAFGGTKAYFALLYSYTINADY